LLHCQQVLILAIILAICVHYAVVVDFISYYFTNSGRVMTGNS